MASTLPPNILSYIGTFINKKDRSHCALVCKHWTEPFLDAYWGKLNIGKYGMDITTLDSNKSCLINAHRVWAVEFFDVHLNDYKYFPKLQRFFPGIRYFQFYDLLSDISTISEAFDWSLWQSLSHLHISFKHDCETVSLQSLFMKLSVLPCLVHLTLYQPYDPPRQITFSWNDFESLHKYLPRLEYLNHSFLFKPITTDEIENIKAVEPAQTTTKIEFTDKVDTLWLFYFALKYPNLRHLTFYEYFGPSNRNNIDYNPQQYQSDLQLLSTLDQFFPCLKMAATTLGYKNMYSRFIFFETLGHFGTKIEHVDLEYGSGVKGDDVNRCIQPISESLKVLEIKFGDKRGAMPFDVCPRLVTLCIIGWETLSITADNILECYPALRSLYVNNAKFYLSTNPPTYTPHPLQKLKIEDSDITNDPLHYLSIRCNQLKHVTLVDIHYNGINERFYEYEDYDEAGKLIFDMSMSNLDTFIFAFTDGLLQKLEVFPRHYIIERMDNDKNTLQATQQSHRINWYHVYRDRTNRKENILKWELGRRDIEFCQRYFKDFGRRKKRGKERKEIKKGIFGFIQRRFWKKDLRYGVYVFRFKSVKNHFFRIK